MTVSLFRKYLNRQSLLSLVAVGILLYAAWMLRVLLLAPSDGAGIYLGQEVIVKQVSAGNPLQPGDSIVRIGSLDVSEGLLQPGYWRTTLFSEVQPSVPYTLWRDGELLQVDVPWARPGLLGFLTRGGTLFLVGVLCALIGVLTLMQGQTQEGEVIQLLVLDIICLALNQVNNVFPASSANVCLTWGWLFIPIDLISIWLFASLALHCLLRFPEITTPLQRFPKLPWIIHGAVPVLSVLGGLLWGDGTALGFRAALFSVTNPLIAIELGLGLVALGHTYATSHRPGVRNQIRWLFWGTTVAVAPWFFFYLLPSLIWGAPWLPLAVTNITVVFLPFSFVIAVMRYGLLEIDRLINRTVVYFLLTGLLVVLYVLVVSATGALWVQRTGSYNNFMAGMIATVVIFLVFNPLRAYTQHLIDRTLYREQFDFHRLIREISQELSETILLDDVVGLLMEEVPRRLGLTHAGLMLLDERQRFYRLWRDVTGPKLAVDSPLVAWFRVNHEPLIVHRPHHFPQELREVAQVFWDLGAEVCLPLYHHAALTGIYLLGSKVSGNLINRQEMESLVLFGHQAAAALQNGQLYLALKDYSQHLENRVTARTAELLSERDRLDTILRNIADGLVVTDTKGKIVLVNPAFSQVVRQADAEVLGRDLCKVFPAEGLELLMQKALNASGAVFTDNLAPALPSGDPVAAPRVYKASACAFLQRYTPIPGRPETLLREASGVVTVLRDITLEMEVDRMKTDFISTVSHELRTPLTAVLGFAKVIERMLEREIAPWLPPKEQEVQASMQRIQNNLEIIVNEGNRLTRLINDVLDVAKMEAGKVEWHMGQVNMVDVINRSVAATKPLAESKKVALKIAVSETLPTVYADGDRLIQVVTNLLSNALKFTDGGFVEARAAKIQLRKPEEARLLGTHAPQLPPGEWLLVSVADTGIGIDEENFPKVFERFQQVGDTLTDRPRGTGLGLTICQEIVAHHKGFIWLESTVGVGSTFSFVLPLAVSAAEAVSTDHSVSAPSVAKTSVISHGGGPLILAVDDDASVRSLLLQELTDAGYTTVGAADGTEALQIVHTLSPALVILDVHMPGIDGLTVARTLKEDRQTAQIPVILLSVSEGVEKGILAGAEAFRTKPLDMPGLLSTVRSLLTDDAQSLQGSGDD